MDMTKPTGSFVAMITPFNRDGSIDFGGFRTLLDFQERNGTSAVLIMGSTGEVSMLSQEERHKVVEETMKFKTGGMQFFYGCTGNNTQTTIDYVQHAAAAGADGTIIAAPAYICAPEADIEQFFFNVAEASDIPVGIYNNPPRVTTDLSAEAILRLAQHPNIVVNKESTGRVGQAAKLAAGNPDMSLMCCDSPNLGLVVPTMSLGGHGTANMSGNIIPAEMAVISKPWESFEDSENFKNMWLDMLPMLHFTYSAINPVPVKSLMRAVGLPAGDLRRPLTGLQGAALQRGLDILRELGLADKYGFTLAAAAE
jgi:4-hydroxy-tetrahydrodipicolinate synthase